ncbi:hypothetical protein J4573_14510 [Actinomadura barringtoniae]|uniref:Uncharacterized protein n=1 Tax=Actinomadura barringtoniae TaxID=1427535 RepID=A0A939T4J6_9ACTN|nr:hypothetical protein [Actinomadura barringtoniae]MBO2448314.1 hypothetical protein [Actinomadura barringtoniae]
MTADMLKEALEAIADRAEPVDGMAERALRRATGRRRTRAIAGASLALAAAIAVPATVVQAQGESGSSSKKPQVLAPATGGLPSNTAAELQAAKACMRDGPPTGNMGEDRPDLGKLPDFRLAVRQRVGGQGGQFVAEVASEKGFVLCSGSSKEGNAEPPTFHPWVGSAAKGGLWDFTAPVRVDAITIVSAIGENGAGSSGDQLHALVTGRVKSDVARVVVTWNFGRTTQATLRNGFFISRVASKMIPDKTATGPMSKGAMTQQDDRLLSVSGYGADGQLVYIFRPQGEDTGRFVPEDCADGITGPKPALCQDLGSRY